MEMFEPSKPLHLTLKKVSASSSLGASVNLYMLYQHGKTDHPCFSTFRVAPLGNRRMPPQSPNSSKVTATLWTKFQQVFQLQKTVVTMGLCLGSRPTSSKLIHPKVQTWLATAFPSSGFQARIKPALRYHWKRRTCFFPGKHRKVCQLFGGNKVFCSIFRGGLT